MAEETFNKFQWSIFTGTNQNQQYVVRTNAFDEFEKAIDDVLNRISDMSPNPTTPIGKFVAPVPAAKTETLPTGEPICAIHNKPMRNGKYGYYCSTKLADGSWCKYKVK